MAHILNRPRTKGKFSLYGHRLAPTADLNGGGEEFVFEPAFGLPLFVYRGDARLAGALNVIQPSPIAALYPQGNPQGIPQITQEFLFQNAWQMESNKVNQPE